MNHILVIVWSAPAAAVAPAIERIAKRARRIVFVSAPRKTAHPLFQQPNPVRAMAEQIERLIETSELPWTFLRPGMFAANALRGWAPQTRVGGWSEYTARGLGCRNRPTCARYVYSRRDHRGTLKDVPGLDNQ